jgi:hypothetical protein
MKMTEQEMVVRLDLSKAAKKTAEPGTVRHVGITAQILLLQEILGLEMTGE